MSHRISESDLAYDASLILEKHLSGYFTIGDGREYRVVQVEHDGTRIVVVVQGTKHLDVIEEQFEVEVRVTKVDL